MADIDSLLDEPEVSAPVPDFTSKSQSVAKSTTQQPTHRPIEDLYKSSTVTGYLFDISGSMTEVIPDQETVDSFEWESPYVNYLEYARERIRKALEAVEQAKQDIAADPAMGTVQQVAGILNATYAEVAEAVLNDDATLKQFIVDKLLYQDLQVPVKSGVKRTTRIDLVSSVAKELIAQKLDQTPDANIFGIKFREYPELFGGKLQEVEVEVDNPAFDPDDPTCDQPEFIMSKELRPGPVNAQTLRHLSKPELLGEVEALSAKDERGSYVNVNGGTNIAEAVKTGLQCFVGMPSPLQMHHLILTTDAEDGSGEQLWNDRAQFKAQHVVLDFIHITKPADQEKRYSWQTGDSNAEYLRKLCAFTGGEYTRVTNAVDFKTKLLAASTRKLLPAGA